MKKIEKHTKGKIQIIILFLSLDETLANKPATGTNIISSLVKTARRAKRALSNCL
ncbi:MAG: hypothetical protein QME54_05015 [Actinomycetota bacterium]|nr:hypothetical protein [Actinomycetota bacterium]